MNTASRRQDPNLHDLDVFHCPLDGIRLIEASAGTGKTWNICGLYLRLLLEAAQPVQHILVVTFTRAATAELKRRIRARIVDMLAFLDAGVPLGAPAEPTEPTASVVSGDPFAAAMLAALTARGLALDQVRERLDAALQTFDEAAIFTIHGYCQRALADTPFAAGLPFALELGEDDSALRLEVARDFWRRHIAAGADGGCPAELGALLAAGGDTPEGWAALLGRVLARPTAQLRWPTALAAADGVQGGSDAGADADADALKPLHLAFEQARAAWQSPRGAATTALLDGMAGNLRGNTYKPDAVVAAARHWQAWFDRGDALAPLSRKEARLELFSAARMAECLNKNGQAPQHPFFVWAADLLAQRDAADAALQMARLALLRRFVEGAPAALRALKRERRRIAFDDILYNVHRALDDGEHPWLAAELHRRYPVALIDEFQDTDPLQFAIFRRIYDSEERHGELFLVGDPKQAIYSFRNADLHTYLHARGLADTRATLRHNQRSDAGLIAACNAVFQANRQAFVLDGLDYVPVATGDKPRQPFHDRSEVPAGGLADERAGAALRVWWIDAASDVADASAAALPTRAEAMRRATQATAAEIARLIGAGDAGQIDIGGVPLRPGDIAVLVKSHRQGAWMREALAALGVGCVELSQQSVFFSSDAEALERLLLAVAEPTRQPRLLAALATPLLGYDAARLDALRDDEGALAAIMARFVRWRELWLARGVAVMLRQCLEDENVAARLLLRDDGERRLTNVLHLAECLHEAAAQCESPDALLRWLAGRMRPDDAEGLGEAAQLRLESDRNLVQIVTIHRAKGLEYAVVFCPYLWDGHVARADAEEGCVYHDLAPDPAAGPADGPRLVLDFRPEARDDAGVALSMRRERDAEFIRLVYVALTRAVHRCYLVAGCYAKPVGRALSTTESTRSLLNWLVAGDGIDYAQWLAYKGEVSDIEAAWSRLLDAGEPHVAIGTLPSGSAAPLRLPAPAADALAARTPPAHLPEGWRTGSFSALLRGAVREEGGEARAGMRDERGGDAWMARDHDAAVGEGGLAAGGLEVAGGADAADGAEGDAATRHDTDGQADVGNDAGAGAGGDAILPPDDILCFPRGPAAGDCLHAVFEHIEFTDASGHDAAIAAALRDYPQRHDDARTAAASGAALAGDAALAAMLRTLVRDVLETPLTDGIVLSRIPPARRLAELGFHLPVPRLGAGALNAWLQQHGYAVPRLAFASLSGYLQGFIDLVFEHDGRFYLLDWKSNHLGERPDDYAPGKLAMAMREHGYHLQHLFYSVALHRHLAHTVPGYQPERHFGGALYLFVRGVRPHWQLGGVPCGVFHHRVDPATLASLDALLGGGRT